MGGQALTSWLRADPGGGSSQPGRGRRAGTLSERRRMAGSYGQPGAGPRMLERLSEAALLTRWAYPADWGAPGCMRAPAWAWAGGCRRLRLATEQLSPPNRNRCPPWERCLQQVAAAAGPGTGPAAGGHPLGPTGQRRGQGVAELTAALLSDRRPPPGRHLVSPAAAGPAAAAPCAASCCPARPAGPSSYERHL